MAEAWSLDFLVIIDRLALHLHGVLTFIENLQEFGIWVFYQRQDVFDSLLDHLGLVLSRVDLVGHSWLDLIVVAHENGQTQKVKSLELRVSYESQPLSCLIFFFLRCSPKLKLSNVFSVCLIFELVC